MATIDTLAKKEGRLGTTATGWTKVSGKFSPYIEKGVTLAALAMTDLVIGTKYTFELRSGHERLGFCRHV